ncbi:unnamed protein product [Didymodactylos carnosus]|uniref:Uncharacterized protein n=1 Tax=Didymodactylos carnosus TaxID=1234261 RepID=A0A815UQC6_9BILA|nr:unnamed protein product [Didymodactylos carnosus]CAF1519222.1 unnamed protein product [Didymodactylos carnosus]CAF4051603.1 unnamed protein product [Didymodactylos carnosus]CAF4378869.1 unnamed protein product [Didymodactylos carnosus]
MLTQGQQDGGDILFAFNGLNSRIQTLFESKQLYRINFQHRQKSKFNWLCNVISPRQIQSLTLSDNPGTTGQIYQFLSKFSFDKFSDTLQSLSLYNVTSDQCKLILSKLSSFKQLTHLSIYIEEEYSNSLISLIHETILSDIIPTLKYFTC